jgi:hypothetical protein
LSAPLSQIENRDESRLSSPIVVMIAVRQGQSRQSWQADEGDRGLATLGGRLASAMMARALVRVT